MLYGNLAHRTAELLWEDKKILKYSDKELEKIVRTQTDLKIQQEGTLLLMDKHKVALKDYTEKTVAALVDLVKMIKNNGWSILSAEQAHESKKEIALFGFIDLVLYRGKELAIVDLKWGGLGGRRSELIKNKELQLVIYDQMLKAKDIRIHLHYYIVSAQTMIGKNNVAFKETVVINSQNEELTERLALWQKMVNTYKLRFEELNQGNIEVGDGMSLWEINGRPEFYEENEDYLQVPQTKTIKEEDKYSVYKSIIGPI